MKKDKQALVHHYLTHGYVICRGAVSIAQIRQILPVINKFHQHWIEDNRAFYQQRAINSAYLTGPTYLNDHDRLTLFRLIADDAIAGIANTLLATPYFLNTQLFFNPANIEQKNYWHRDGQYHLSLEQQRLSLQQADVLHIRVALKSEHGIEVVPGTHRRWDTEQELNTRLEQAGCQSHDDLPDAKQIAMEAGDVVVFSANMLHRGIYGKDRLAFDILFADYVPDALKFASANCLPSDAMLSVLSHPEPFRATKQFLAANDDE